MKYSPDYGCNGENHSMNEEAFIAGYVALTGASPGLARNVYMFLDTIPGHGRPFVNGELQHLGQRVGEKGVT